ncbi:MAG: 4-alpha-glucanotransferase [Lachnospiraceae bacterium]|nr:4-alpha-glucanotransferase [Lachnospiraceae bacterium]
MRASGILMPISSLPSPYGIGCFSREAYAFADRLKEAGQTYWQILPLGPTGYGDSPYQSFSAFAGNPYFIDLDTLCEEGLLERDELEGVDFGQGEPRINYGKLYENRFSVLGLAFSRWKQQGMDARDAEYLRFCREESSWLEEYALYMALKERFGQKSWEYWEAGERLRDPETVQCRREEHAAQMDFYRFLQFQFMRQWKRLRAYVNSLGIRIIGDIPIYVSLDSSDSWANPELFLLDEDRRPLKVAGCPPDAFAADGQLWGNPLYDWDYHEKTGYAWWISRIRRCFALYDVVRVDHFRGFDEYYAIPREAATAAAGSWEKGPGMKLFDALKRAFGKVPIIAEDLGYVTPSVQELVRQSTFPSMKVMEFAFDSREAGDYLPHNYTRNCVVYTGTHDNQTLLAWQEELSCEDVAFMEEYLMLQGKTKEERVWALIRLTLATVADTAIIPMQDYLVLGREGRMNRPSTMGGNWRWRMDPDAFTMELAGKIRKLCQLYGR